MSLLDGLHSHLSSPNVDAMEALDQDMHSEFDYVLESLTDEKLKSENSELSHLLCAIESLSEE